jgi:tRNA 2-thiouridine synthesizing protein A
MSESRRKLDERGLACPQPVIDVKKALEEGGFDMLEVLVDGPTARENVTRFAVYAGHAIEGVEEAAGTTTIRIRRAGAPASFSVAKSAPAAVAASGAANVFVSSDTIGSGNDELGALLMRGFLSALAEASPAPGRVILMNGGVRLAVEGSAALTGLARLSELGVEILACGTCLDFYGVKDRLAVGRVSNMFEISGLLLEGPTLSL